MRKACFAALIALTTSGPVLAQTATGSSAAVQPRRPYATPLDRGPFTPEASRAYQGGGVILQGAPGAPAPAAAPTPPGQVPRNAVSPQ
jgi:hypothetical protein